MRVWINDQWLSDVDVQRVRPYMAGSMRRNTPHSLREMQSSRLERERDVGDAGDGLDENGIDHNSSFGECMGSGGNWVDGYVADDWVFYNTNTGMFQVTALGDNGQGDLVISYSLFGLDGQGSSVTSADAWWLIGQLVGKNTLDDYMQLLSSRDTPVRGGGLNNLFSGPGLSTDAPNNWARPAGMGPPLSQGDWAASMHDSNFAANGHIGLGDYFNPFLPGWKSRDMIMSNLELIGHAGGFQSVKMGIFFGGIVNPFQIVVNAWRYP